MKVIDLLVKMANGEEVPQHIKLKSGIELYYCEDTLNYYNELGCNELFGPWIAYNLNEEVEIIEEDKKIEKVFHCNISTSNKEIDFIQKNINQLSDKVNEIIDEINKLKEGK